MSTHSGRLTRLRPRSDVGEELMGAAPTRSPTWRSACN
jgi:hypothetical protein